MKNLYFRGMKNQLIIIALFSIVISASSCTDDEPIITPKLDYAFFVAGHAYGKHGVNNAGLHPPFEAFYDDINTYPNLLFGVLTGDIVLSSTAQNWDDVDNSLQQLNMPIYFAFGNHDYNPSPLLANSRYGDGYQAFQQHNDLFIILDSNQDSLNISGRQLDFLTNTLDSLGQTSEHIFVFVHHMIWWEEDNVFRLALPNSLAQKAQQVNFWTEIEPLFNELDKPVYFFCGDAGANYITRSLTYYKYGDLTYVTSGMGYGEKDNFIHVEVMENNEVKLNVIGLNCAEGADCMGDIEDYPPF